MLSQTQPCYCSTTSVWMRHHIWECHQRVSSSLWIEITSQYQLTRGITAQFHPQGVKKELLRCTAGHCRRIHHDGPMKWCDVHPWSLTFQATISQFHTPPQKLPQDLSNTLFYREQLPLETSIMLAPRTGLPQAKGQSAPAGLSPPDSFHRYPGTV